MTASQDIRAAACEILNAIAPEADLGQIDPAQSLQQQLDLDSFDFLQFVQGLYDRLGVEIPEADYPQVASLDGCVTYVERRLAAPARDAG